MFNYVCLSVECYGSLVLCFQAYGALEKFKKDFLKKLFAHILLRTSNFILTLRSSYPTAIKLHFQYCGQYFVWR